MQTRYRWYRIRLPKNSKGLDVALAAIPFLADSREGFVAIQASPGSSGFRFLWRSTVTVTQLDDSGEPASQVIETVNFCDFSVVTIDGGLYIRVENPGRSLRDLFNALEAAVGFGFTCKLLTFDSRPATLFKNVDAIKMIGLKVVGAVVDEDVVARMEFVSKQGMSLDGLHILEGIHHKVEYAAYELLYEGVKGQVAFSATGNVKLSGQLAPKVLHLIECDLPKLK